MALLNGLYVCNVSTCGTSAAKWSRLDVVLPVDAAAACRPRGAEPRRRHGRISTAVGVSQTFKFPLGNFSALFPRPVRQNLCSRLQSSAQTCMTTIAGGGERHTHTGGAAVANAIPAAGVTQPHASVAVATEQRFFVSCSGNKPKLDRVAAS